MTKRARHQFFTEQNTGFTTDSIYIPDSPLLLKNNCKEGCWRPTFLFLIRKSSIKQQLLVLTDNLSIKDFLIKNKFFAWQLGDTNYGSRLKLVALKFSRYLHMGNDAIAAGAPIGQLWFCPIDGGIRSDEQGNEIQLALNLVYYTLLKNSKSGKSGSLLNFGQKAALLQGQGIDYREVVWIPKFIKKSGTVTNDIGQAESASWYVLDWGVVLPEDQDDSTYEKIGNLIDILSSTEEMGKLIDPIVEGECRCVDGLKPQQIAQLANSMAASVNGSTPALTPG